MKKKHEVVTVPISPKGFELLPGKIYLGSTVEECGSDHYVCCIEGRSSVGRLGIQVHMTAGFGDLGFKGRWTLEIRVAQPVVVYPFVRIAQAYFIKPYGMITKLYTGKYKGQTGIERSKMAEDFTPPTE
jgi:dCTP deaminase